MSKNTSPAHVVLTAEKVMEIDLKNLQTKMASRKVRVK